MTQQQTGAACRAVVERLVEAGAGPLDRATEEHVGSCIACFRVMTELRDLPRIEQALRADTPDLPVGDRFWETLAARTTDASAAALAGETPLQAPPAAAPARARRVVRSRLVSFGGLAVAAAAGWMLMVGRQTAPPPSIAPVPAAVGTGRLAADEASGEALNDVADLDAAGLRRLLTQLGAHAPAALAGGETDGTDVADVPADDEARVSDEVADLDGDGLRRVATSLERAAL